MTNYQHRGETITVNAPRNVTSGQGVLVGGLFGIAATTVLSGASLELTTFGVFSMPKDTSLLPDGADVYWDNVNFVATSNEGPNKKIGVANLADPSGTNQPGALTGDATVTVRLNFQPTEANTLHIAHFLYSFAVDGGASVTPSISDTIPANAIVFGGSINSSTALLAAGSATFALGTTAGSSATSILAATGKATLSLDAVVAPTAVATPFKMSAAGQIAVTVATGPLTAGVVEGWVLYTVATNA